MSPTLGTYDFKLNRAGKLRGDEQVCSAAIERLCERFPWAGEENVVNALREADGHAGRAAAALRVTCEPRSKPSSSPSHPSQRARDEHNSNIPVSIAEAASAKPQRKPAPAEDDGVAVAGRQKLRRDSEAVAALAREGRRLQRELDGALAEARAERLRADSLAAERRVASAAEAARAPVAHSAGPLPRSCDSSGSHAQLLAELDASRDEGRRLRQELEGALGAVAASSEGIHERERLRRELDAILEERSWAARPTTSVTASEFNKVQSAYSIDANSTPPARARAFPETLLLSSDDRSAKAFGAGGFHTETANVLGGQHSTDSAANQRPVFPERVDGDISWAGLDLQSETSTRSKSPPYGAPSSDSDTEWNRPTDLEREYLLERERLRRKLAELRSMFSSSASHGDLSSRAGAPAHWL